MRAGAPSAGTPEVLRSRHLHTSLLVDAGIALAESLDMSETLSRVARLTAGPLADLCVIDLLQDDGSIRLVAAVAVEEKLERELHDLRERHQLDAAGNHPVASVIRTGEPMLLDHVSDSGRRTVALGLAHRRFIGSTGYNSAIVAPLQARSRTLGTLSVLRVGDGLQYDEHEMDVVCELARRAALAIDNSRLFSEARAVEQRLEAILKTMAEAITVTDEHDRVVFANRAAAELFGVDAPEELTGHGQQELMGRFLILDEDGNEIDPAQMPRLRVLSDGAAEPRLIRSVVRSSGQERWLMARPAPVSDPDSGGLLFSVNVYEDITQVKRVQLTESFMSEASRVLASSMDYDETLSRVAELAVPQIADWCAVDVLSEDGSVRRVAAHHADPDRLSLAMRLDRGYPVAANEALGVAEVIRTGRPQIYEHVTPGLLAEYARDSEHLAMLQKVGATAVIIVPLAAPTGPVGAITLVSADSTRRLNGADLELAVRLGRRAGTAVESARLYTERGRIADILQQALLPEVLPAIPGVQISALYRPSGELNEVGGDFYDVFTLGDGRWMLAIGDVCGKGPRAAGVTALARHTLRTAAMLGASPAGMLDTLHEALRRQPAGADLVTVCLVTLEHLGAHADVTVTLAGHPHPLIVGAGGEVRTVGAPGTLLGVLDPIRNREIAAELLPGQTLLLYTDGLLEASRSADAPELDWVLEMGADASRMDLDRLLERIQERAVADAGGSLRDDIAMLALRLDGPPTGGDGGPAVSAAPERDLRPGPLNGLEPAPTGLRIGYVGDGDQLSIDVRRDTDRVVIVLEGELDMATAPRLQGAIDDPGVASMPSIVIDLRQLQFIDSTGLRVILAALQASRERGQEFAITRGSAQVERLLSITGVAEHMRAIDSPEALLDGHQGQ